MTYSENQYLRLLKDIYTYGQDTSDRTGTGMRSLFGEKMEFDLREGFPLLTTKKMFTRGVFAELLWFLSGSTSNAELEEKYNVHFWKKWANDKGELNNIYGKQWIRWESSQKIVKVKQKNNLNLNTDLEDVTVNELRTPNLNSEDLFVGTIVTTKKHGDLIVLDFNSYYIDSKGRNKGRTYDIQFLKTGHIMEKVKKENIKNGEVADPYFRSVYGVGYNGGCIINNKADESLYTAWNNMLERCYSTDSKQYKYYGAKGIRVHSRWHSLKNFIEDVKKIPNWNLKKYNLTNYHLDKDYYGSNIYSKESCVWLHKDENKLYSKSKPFYILNDDNKELFINISECARKFNLDPSAISKCLLGKHKQTKGYTFEYLEYDKDKYVYRYSLPFNQIQYIIDEIRNNPTSRRILFTGWNAPEMQWEDTALPCCHSTVVQFYVEDGYLNLYHHQRSGDMFLGVPVNIASYATLLMMVAQQTGLKAGKMIHSIGVAHIYHNHFEQVEKQLSRQPYELPQLIIKRQPESIFDYKLDDFEVVNYQHHPLIKGDVAV